MRNFLKLLLISILLLPLSVASAKNTVPATNCPVVGLVERLLPGYESQFIFEVISTGKDKDKDYFELSSSGSKIKITGNNPVSVSAGLNWYLKYYCNCSFSFCKDQLELPKKLPLLKEKIRKETKLIYNFYMNYCTFGYTTPFWDWERWEREIDLMALNGINTPMAMVGVEVVWRNTLRRFGYTDREIKEFLCGPVYFPWFLMANMEKLGGPLPDEWFDRQVVLQRKILKRMREFGMRPVFQAFFGMVPNSLKEKYPDAKIADQGLWQSFKRPEILLSTDSLFARMSRVWYQEYEKLFGRTDCFAGDLFHEGGISEGLDVPQIARGVQAKMMEYEPNAIWFIQAWGDNPQNELLSGLDKRHTIIVDLSAEYWTRWKERKGFNGFPWIWSHVTDYGGNIGLHGRLDAIAKGSLDGRSDPVASASMIGIGAVPEGIEVNPIAFDLANEMRWREEAVDVEEWVAKYARRRYNTEDENIEKAWNIFYRTVYGTYENHRRPSESVFCAQPSLKGDLITASAWNQCKIYYDPQLYAKGVAYLLESSEELERKETYQFDVVDMVRQYLADLGRDAYARIVQAYRNKERKILAEQSERFLELMKDQDKLLSSYNHFFVGRWLGLARSASQIKKHQDLYEKNARQLIGTWSEENTMLRDYAHKEWGGMLKDYYYPRWKAYLDYLSASLDGKDLPEPDSFLEERKWIESHNRYTFVQVDAVKVAKELFGKYYSD